MTERYVARCPLCERINVWGEVPVICDDFIRGEMKNGEQYFIFGYGDERQEVKAEKDESK